MSLSFFSQTASGVYLLLMIVNEFAVVSHDEDGGIIFLKWQNKKEGIKYRVWGTVKGK